MDISIKRGFERIKRLAIIAMVSNDYLMERLVLKGGNALDIIYHIASRSSVDLDFSICDDFPKDELKKIEEAVIHTITTTFNEARYVAFDVTFRERPRRRRSDQPDFWGGYKIEFKVIEKERYKNIKHDMETLRRNAITLDSAQHRKIEIDISKFEYCDGRREAELDGYTVYVYPLEMILFEKLRAICQQMPEYAVALKTTRKARARDFFDIHTICEHSPINVEAEEHKALIKTAFEIKRVPLELLGKIGDYRDFHRQDFPAVRQTAAGDVKEFDYYFDFVAALGKRILHSLGIMKAPPL
ncbi:MAG: nucleotidyl transferase AbiEii/AbiGii toxin family protein [Candidatus Eremiobacteraeota bacterium]|nr:nucleotidyl transferase AbiEii/AbiGii toxin family protein [Candidatus Eremiobacteraeota bacterium]